MSRSAEQIEKDIAELPEVERVELIDRLYADSHKMEPEIQKAWVDESERRLDELLSGKVKGVPMEEAFAQIEAKFQEKMHEKT